MVCLPQAITRASGTAQSSARSVEHIARRFRASYDVSRTTNENRRHWAAADALSANAANSPAVRATLRNRARYEFQNNSMCHGIVCTLAMDLIGTGARLQLRSPSIRRADLTKVERLFNAWMREVGLGSKSRIMRMAVCFDGEAFAKFTTNGKLRSQVKLDVQLVDCDRITASFLDLESERHVDGIWFDEAGNPERYRILRKHPGGVEPQGIDEADPIDAEHIIHYFKPTRAEQRRGVPELTPALPLFAMSRSYSLATLAAAETAADVAMVIYSDGAAGDEGDQPAPMDLFDLERRMATTLPAGWKLDQMKANQPVDTYPEYRRELIAEIARCLGMPYNLAAGDSSDYNYASGRLDHQSFFRAQRVDRGDFEDIVLQRAWERWLSEAVLISGYLPQVFRARTLDIETEWNWDGHPHVDPQKEANAQATRLASGTTTLRREYHDQGLDWEEELRQLALETKLRREAGIPVPGETKVDAGDNGGGDEDEDDGGGGEKKKPAKQRPRERRRPEASHAG